MLSLHAKKLCQNGKTREMNEESPFWKFVAALIPQIGPRGKNELVYEHDENDECTAVCHMVRLGQKNVKS
jgi:hypothetical protein